MKEIIKRLSISILFVGLILSTTYAQINPASPEYEMLKSSGAIPIPEQVEFNGPIPTISAEPILKSAKEASCLLIPLDDSFTYLERNDDFYTSEISLPFDFDFYGSIQRSCWINNNGNVSFDGPYSAYTATGFPVNGFPMLAPFWADVDTRNAASGLMWYKVEQHRVIVIWDAVGYYNTEADKVSTFELIFTDGTDPLVGIGNNVAFSYDDMQWTTGSASGGSGGFGGVPSTVGVNKGDGTTFALVGRFDHEGVDYDGPGGNSDGVSYLDCKNFFFSTTTNSNIPPVASGFPASPVTITLGDVWNYSVQFLSPELGQSTSTLVDDGGLSDFAYTTTTGSVSQIDLNVTGTNDNLGSHTLVFTATDDGSPVGVTTVYLEIIVVCTNPASGGEIGNAQGNCGEFNPTAITSVSLPNGHAGTLEYKWKYSTDMVTFFDISESNSETYDPGLITQTTFYKRLSRVTCKSDWTGAAESNVVKMEVMIAPTVTTASVTPESVVGSGQVVFSASASSGDIKWYDEPTGGNEVTALNPIITSTTTYYAEAISNGCVSSSRTAVTATVIPAGQTQLNFKFANPRITNVSGTNYFEFDIQAKANEAGTYLWSGQIILKFDNTALSTAVAEWFISRPSPFSDLNSAGNPKYATIKTITGTSPNKVLNIGYLGDVNVVKNSASSADFVEITTSYQTLASVRGRIISNTGVAGIDFKEANMNGYQFNKLSDSPWYAAYTNPNLYDDADFVDTYVERVFCTNYPWTQIGGLDWAEPVNTSVWDGNAQTPSGDLANASNLRIHIPATLSVPANGEMTVTGATEIKPSKGLVFESDANGTGSFITTTSLGAGSALAQRYMTTDAWHIVASPVSGQSIADFLASNDNVGVDADAVDIHEPDVIRGMMDYVPALNEWNDYFTNSESGSLETGKGFSMRTIEDGIISFNGNLQTGSQSATGLTPAKWNCVGNPYSSAIAINANSLNGVDDFLNANAIVAQNLDPSFGAIYIWSNTDENNGVWGQYTIISNTPVLGSDAAFDVQQGQAFMVKMNASATNIDFNSNMQFHGPALALKATKGIWPTIKLEVAGNYGKSSTIIAFNNAMTKGLDPTYDAGLLKGGSDLMVYSRLVEDNGISFAIQALPTNDYDKLIIPIGLDFKTGGEVIFSSELIDLSPDCRVILEDIQSKTFTDLSKDVYKTSVEANSKISDRFRIHTSYLTTGLDVENMAEKLNAYAIRNIEMIVRGNVSSQAVASVYDVQGRLVLTKKLDAGNRNSLRLPMIKTGIYMLYVKDNGKVQGFKIPVKE